jgi:predicted O-linked N-acetylglucosamine transferase (SPINDLY family)
MASFRRAVELDPRHADAQCNLGNALYGMGLPNDALACYRRVLEVRPDSAEAHCNVGVALRSIGRFDDAEASLRRALDIDTGIADIHFNLGNVLQDVGKLHDAARAFRRTIEINPRHADAHCNLGNALYGIGMLNDALACYRRALELDPNHVLTLSNMGCALSALGYGDDAVARFREALRLDPDFGNARSNLLFNLNYGPGQGGVTMLEEARRYGDLVARKAHPFTDWRNVPDSSRRLRVGFVSGDLRNHAVGNFVKGALAALASRAGDQLEIIGYPTHFLSDAVTEGIRASCSGWHSAVRLSDQDFAQRIRDDRIDVLIDLSGHTEHNRLPMFAWKPAPVQATWLGYLATTGVAAIDYVIADSWTLPESEAANFTEKIWRLPKSYLCFTPPDDRSPIAPLPALTHRRITFGSFNNLAKMNDDVVALWARVLRALPESQLFLKAKQFADARVQQTVRDRFGAHGIEPARLVLAQQVPLAEYLAPYSKVDISLDPFPYQGITTSVESLWMGVPVLTLAGKSFLSRQGVGLLMNAGLPDWIASDEEDYVARAIAHASDLPRLASVRDGLRERMRSSPIFDTAQFADHFATAMHGMWQQWRNQQQGARTAGFENA